MTITDDAMPRGWAGQPPVDVNSHPFESERLGSIGDYVEAHPPNLTQECIGGRSTPSMTEVVKVSCGCGNSRRGHASVAQARSPISLVRKEAGFESELAGRVGSGWSLPGPRG